MTTKTVTLTTEQWDHILDAAQSHWDQGPHSEGWQSDELTSACRALEKELESE